MNIKNKEELIRELQKSGFPLEVAVLNTLDSLAMSVRPSESYVDSKINIIREIDIHALDFYPIKSDIFWTKIDRNQKRIIAHYIIECKNNKGSAWIFFTNSTHQKLQPHHLFWKTLNDPRLHNGMIKPANLDLDRVSPDPFFYRKNQEIITALKIFQGKEKLHVSYVEVPFNKARSSIHDATSSVIKATEFLSNRYQADKVIHLFIPLIVTTGDLWSASLMGSKSTNKIKLKKANFIIATYPTLENEKYGKNILYFVVKENYLKIFLKNFRKLSEKINFEWSKA